MLSENFYQLKKQKRSWEELKPMVISHLNDYFEKNNEPILKKSKKIMKKIQKQMKLLTKLPSFRYQVRPAVARDGGNVKFKSFENGS